MTFSKYIYIVLFAFLLTGCNDDFLNTRPLGEVSGEDVWSDPALAQAFVYEIYNGFGNGGFYEQQMASMTDEALFTHPGRNINTVTESRSNAANQGYIMDTYQYGNLYARIRATNVGIFNLYATPFENEEVTQQLLGELYFLRGYFYHQLLRFYGAVPIIEKVYQLNDQEVEVERATYEDCVDFIVNNCDSAAMLLAGKNLLDGQATEVAALALKARVLTYAASDLHHVPTASQKSPTLASYDHSEYFGFLGGDRTDRWRQAKDAAKAVLDHTEHAYQLDLDAPLVADDAKYTYQSIAMAGGSSITDADAKRDLILGRFFNPLKDESGNWLGRDNGPNGYHNWAGNTPTQLLVDDYEMLDGSRFDWDNPIHREAPYQNRDPRFYSTILYDGADWKPRTADVRNRDPFNQIQTGQYQVVVGGNTVTQYGLDTRNSPVEDWNGSYTGYYYRKFIDADPAIEDQNTKQFIPWPVLRYTEAVLNYVEACLELGEDTEAQLWLNKIRFRAGMPAITETGPALKNRYRNERRIELAYEEHRYFDARRWMIAPETLGRKVTMISISGMLKPGASVSTYQYSLENYNYRYNVIELAPGIENRSWQDKMYFMCFHRDEMNRNGLLIQNPGYE